MSPYNLGRKARDSHIIDEETEAQTDEVTCAKSQLGHGEPRLSPIRLAFLTACCAGRCRVGEGSCWGLFTVRVHQASVFFFFFLKIEVLASQGSSSLPAEM